MWLYFWLQGLITRTSEYLFEATSGQTYFRQVSILLPSNWAHSNCTGEPSSFPDRSYQYNQEVVSTATFQTQSSADIHVTADHPVYIDKPWTLQYGPCGVPGKKISIPISFITEEGSESNPDSLRGKNYHNCRFCISIRNDCHMPILVWVVSWQSVEMKEPPRIKYIKAR